MKKILLLIVTILSFAFIGSVSAEELAVKTLDASIDGTKITAKGTTDENMLAVSVLVYDETGKTFIKMASGQVEDGKYEVNVDGFETGKKYMVRVSNYDGGDFLEQLVPETTEESKEATPDTNDDVLLWFSLGLISIISLTGLAVYKRKFN